MFKFQILLDGKSKQPTRPNENETEHTKLHDIILSKAEEIRPFIIDEALTPKGFIAEDRQGPTPLDLPFKICSFEMAGKQPLFTLADSRPIIADCAVVYEIEPLKYGIWTLLIKENEFPNEKKYYGVAYMLADSFGRNSATLQAIQNILTVFSKERIEVGEQKIKEKMRIGRGPERKLATFRSVVRVVPTHKKETDELKRLQINWNHRWEVRGHWRRCQRIGKDRSGSYCVNGFTWVNEHVKGPEQAPIILKSRTTSKLDFNGVLEQKPNPKSAHFIQSCITL